MTTELAPPSKWADKFDLVYRWYKDQTGQIKLHKDLARQVDWWEWIYSKMRTGKYTRETDLINEILKRAETTGEKLSTRTARNYIADTRRFFASADEVNQAFEKVMLIQDLKEDIRLARLKGDYRALAAFRKLFATVIGADQPVKSVDNRTVINILNYNPAQLGGKEIDSAKLDKLINNLLAEDKKREDAFFDDFIDVTPA